MFHLIYTLWLECDLTSGRLANEGISTKRRDTIKEASILGYFRLSVIIIWLRNLPFRNIQSFSTQPGPNLTFLLKPMCHAPVVQVPRFWISRLINCHSSSVSMETKCSGTRVPPFFKSCMHRGFLLMRASFVMLLTTRSDARARKGVSFYLSACRFPVFLYTNCTSVYLVWQIHFFSDLEMYYACEFVIKAMIICSSQMDVLDFGPALAY